jgi:hypothetical protein
MDDEIPNVNGVIGVLEAGHPHFLIIEGRLLNPDNRPVAGVHNAIRNSRSQLPLEGHDKFIADFEIRSRKNSGAGMTLAVHAQPMSSAVLVEFDDPNPYDFFDAVHLRLAPLTASNGGS